MHHAMRRQFHATIFAIPLLCLGVGLKAQDNGVADKATFEEASLLMEEKLYGQAALEWKALLAMFARRATSSNSNPRADC